MFGNPPHADWPGTPRCHLFVRDGRIEFLGDSEHELKGGTVDMVEWTDDFWHKG